MNATALIAEDEPLLAANLQAELARAWPELRIVANVGHGAAAVDEALARRPDVVFLDIRMPGMTGLEAAQAMAEDWPADAPLPLIVFVTAYDQYALQAFDQAAVDYVLKPVQADRLRQTCARIRAALIRRAGPPGSAATSAAANLDPNAQKNPEANAQVKAEAIEAALGQLRSLLGHAGLQPAATQPLPKLTVLQAGVGAAIHLVPVAEVLYFEAADKYVRVVTAEREYLVRTSLRELLPRLDEQKFWQIHRGTVVRADAIATATREETGKVTITLRGHPDRLVASRLHAHLFKAM